MISAALAPACTGENLQEFMNTGESATENLHTAFQEEGDSSTSASSARGLQNFASSSVHSLSDFPIPKTLNRPSMDISWSQTNMRSTINRKLSPDQLHVRSGGASIRRELEASIVGAGSGSFSVRTGGSTTVAAQQCQLPPTPSCNASAALQIWEEVLESLDLERVLLLSCEAIDQVEEIAIVRYLSLIHI